VLNALWSYLFFGLHRPGMALIEILVLWGVLLVVTVMFWRAIRLAGVLLLPYLLWTGFASYLNFALWRLN
jgi:tryptophan-rich sensory protein